MPYDTNDSLAGNLQEFGLSKYEAKAYLTMVVKGSLSASELAYYANLPRTKVYPTLKKLEKKKLSIISQNKPLICSAIEPSEAFKEFLGDQERKLKDMKRIISKLQSINEEIFKFKGSEEHKYHIFNASIAKEKIESLFQNSRIQINAILDLWGLRLFVLCKSSIEQALKNNTIIRLLIPKNCIYNDNLSYFSKRIEIKVIDEFFTNEIIIDSSILVNIDSSNGKAAIVNSDMLASPCMKKFKKSWDVSLSISDAKINTIKESKIC